MSALGQTTGLLVGEVTRREYRLYRFCFVPSRGMHLRVRSTPDVVICDPETSLICPAGQVPSSTRTRWPRRKSTMSVPARPVARLRLSESL